MMTGISGIEECAHHGALGCDEDGQLGKPFITKVAQRFQNLFPFL